MAVVLQELGFLKYLKAAKVTMNEFEFPQKKIANVQVCLLFPLCPPLRAHPPVCAHLGTPPA